MKIPQSILSLSFLMVSIGAAQGPLFDKITVNVPYPIHVNGTLLQPGDYEIRQDESMGGGSRVLHFYSNNGMSLQTTAMSIPTVDNRTPTESKLVVDHYGSDYYLHKVWVQGKDYGYEFPLPDNIRMRENERNLPSIATVRYEATTQTAQATAPQQSAPAATTPQESAATPAPAESAPGAAAPAPAPEAAPAPAPAQETQQLAQNRSDSSAQTSNSSSTDNTQHMAADRGSPAMPATAGNWLNLLLSGVLLTSSGLVLRRYRA